VNRAQPAALDHRYAVPEMETAQRLITAEEYLAREFDDRFTELINGRVVVNQALIPHQTIVGRSAEIAAPAVLTSPQLAGFELDLGGLFSPAF
jgi:hypothetical protein